MSEKGFGGVVGTILILMLTRRTGWFRWWTDSRIQC